MKNANQQYPQVIPTIMKFREESHNNSPRIRLSSEVLTSLTPVQLCRAVHIMMTSTVNCGHFFAKFVTAAASSAGVERVFSSDGLVHSKLRNTVETEQAAKLVLL